LKRAKRRKDSPLSDRCKIQKDIDVQAEGLVPSPGWRRAFCATTLGEEIFKSQSAESADSKTESRLQRFIVWVLFHPGLWRKKRASTLG